MTDVVETVDVAVGTAHEELVNKDLTEMATFLSELPGLKVPTGFHSILESFSREVLREQPEDIIQFGFKYFEGQMKRPGRKGLAGIMKK